MTIYVSTSIPVIQHKMICYLLKDKKKIISIQSIVLSTRTLFSEKILGISAYETQRMRINGYQMNKKKLKFEMRMNNPEQLIATTKQMIHLMDKSNESKVLLQQSLRTINKLPDEKRTYLFGPLVMRMFHYLNLPDEANQVFDQQMLLLYLF